MRKWIASLIQDGWPKGKEPKAFEVMKDLRYGKAEMCKIIGMLTAIPSLEISYLVVNKPMITNNSFRNAPYGTAYNYFTGVLLSELVFQDKFLDVKMTYDRRNKETHNNKHFREYLNTRAF